MYEEDDEKYDIIATTTTITKIVKDIITERKGKREKKIKNKL